MTSQTAAVPLLLLPGTLCDGRLFAPMLERLPGRAASVGNMLGQQSHAALAEQILHDAPPHFALVGFSLGGIVALEIASRAPERVLGLAMIDSNGRVIPSDQHAARRRAIANVASAADHVGLTLWPDYVAASRLGDERLRQLVMEMAADCPPDTLPNQIEVALSRPDSRPRLSGMTMPALVLAGEEDRLCTPEMQRELASALPAARLVMLPGVGHFAPLEQPGAVAAAVAEWLIEVDNRALSANVIAR